MLKIKRLRALALYFIATSVLTFSGLHGQTPYAQASGSKPVSSNVGMRTFGIWNNENTQRLDVSVWYPSFSSGREAHREGWTILSSSAVRAIPGFYPVILLSHDSASSRYANNDLAYALASNGFIVVVPTHYGDNLHSGGLLYTAQLLYDRPRELLFALETALSSPELSPYMDESRIGILGVGFGSITAMQMAGFTPDATGLEQYCGREENSSDIFCASWSGERMKTLQSDIDAILKKTGKKAFTPNLTAYAPSLESAPIPPAPEPVEEPVEQPKDIDKKSLITSFAERIGLKKKHEATESEIAQKISADDGNDSQQAEFMYLLDFQGGELFGGTTNGGKFVEFESFDAPLMRFTIEKKQAEPESQKDIRPDNRPHRRPANVRSIKSLALLSPSGGALFPVTARQQAPMLPITIVAAQYDAFYPFASHGKPYKDFFGSMANLVMLQSDHFSLFSPCANDLVAELKELCGKIQGEERDLLTQKRDQVLVDFFKQTLGQPLPEQPLTGFVAVEEKKEEKKPAVNATAKETAKVEKGRKTPRSR